MKNQTVITVSIPYKVFCFLSSAVLTYVFYIWLGGPNDFDTVSRNETAYKLVPMLWLLSASTVFSVLSFFFDFRKIIIDQNGISNVEIANTRQVLWGEIISIADVRWGVRITTKNETFSISRWGMAKNEIWKAIELHANGANSISGQLKTPDRRLF